MRHEHLVVTVEAGTKERIDEDLDAGESLESWVADAIERKLAVDDRPDPREADDGAARGSERDGRIARRNDDARRRPGDGRDDEGTGGGRSDAFERDGFESDGGDEYDEGFEYVDDCSI